jgi:hypothetical protein
VRIFALLAAVTAAAALPGEPLGVGVGIVAVLVAATVVAGGPRSLDAALFGPLALALAFMPALLDALWVVVVDLGAGLLLATAGVAGPRAVALLAPVRALDGLPELVPATPAGSATAVRGLVIGAIVVLPFGGLFWSADPAFAEVASASVPSLPSLPERLVVFAVVLLVSLGLALAAGRSFPDPPPTPPTLAFAEWAIPLALLNLLFVAFVAVQVTVLFGGHDHVLETAGLTYAEYAREGFWQLIAAAALTLLVIAAALRLAQVRRPADRTLLRALLGTLCVLTLVTVASALHRLNLYEDAYGLTRLRLAAETAAWALGGMFVVLVVAGAIHLRRTQLVRVVITAAAIGLIAFSLSNPDGRVAERNVDRWRQTGDLDVSYLRGLSADAVPALADLPEPLRSRALAPFGDRLAEDDPWLSISYSRYRARKLLDRRP